MQFFVSNSCGWDCTLWYKLFLCILVSFYSIKIFVKHMIVSLCDMDHISLTAWKQTQKKSFLFFCFCLKIFSTQTRRWNTCPVNMLMIQSFLEMFLHQMFSLKVFESILIAQTCTCRTKHNGQIHQIDSCAKLFNGKGILCMTVTTRSHQ